MKTFFWGYLSKPWKRLLRTLSTIIIILFVYVYKESNNEVEKNILLIIIMSIPILSYVLEPFILKNTLLKTESKKKVTEREVGLSNNIESLTKEEVREKGRKLLEEIQKKGPDLSKVGKTVVHLKGGIKKI